MINKYTIRFIEENGECHDQLDFQSRKAAIKWLKEDGPCQIEWKRSEGRTIIKREGHEGVAEITTLDFAANA